MKFDKEAAVQFYKASRIVEEARHQTTLMGDSSHPFHVLSFNILAQGSIKREQYSYCAHDTLKWWFRRDRLAAEIEAYSPDLAAFQEMDQYEKFFKGQLEKIGLSSIYSRKRESIQQGDGLCIAWKPERFELVDWKKESLAETMTHLPEAIPNIALFAIFRDLKAGGKLLAFSTCHLYWHWEYDHLRAIQAHFVFKKLHSWIAKVSTEKDLKIDGKPRVIVCGDFNSDPKSIAYQMITSKRIRHSHFENVMGKSEMDQEKLDKMLAYFNQHPYQSAYACQQLYPNKPHAAYSEISWTNHVNSYKDTLDYIFFRKMEQVGGLGVTRLLMEPPAELVEAEGGLPNHNYSSDHLALLAEFAYIESA